MGLTFFRHPPTDAMGLCYGRQDVPLAPGHQDAIARATLVLPTNASHVVSSPSARCVALAHPLAQSADIPLKLDARLMELNFGEWEGRPWAEIDRAESDRWASSPLTKAPPGGETFAELTRRVTEVLTGLTDCVIVTHAGPIRAWQIALGLMDFDTAFARSVPYAQPIVLPSRPG